MSSSTGRTLSNGTLGLRFMQNAQRAKQQETIDLQRAKVNDEAEWEVSKDVREAWGLLSSSKAQAGQSITHETSYLPFLFPSLHKSSRSSDDESESEASTSKINGRRTFSEGREVVPTEYSVVPPSVAESQTSQERGQPSAILQPTGTANTPTPGTTQRKTRIVPRPGALTAPRAGKLAEMDRTGLLPIGAPMAPGIPVLTMISEESSAAVGLDMRQMRKLKDKGAAGTSVGPAADAGEPAGVARKSFLRPAGVDSPAANASTGTIAKKVKKRDREEDGAGVAGSPGGPGQASASGVAINDDKEGQRQVKQKRKKQKKQTETSGISTPAY